MIRKPTKTVDVDEAELASLREARDLPFREKLRWIEDASRVVQHMSRGPMTVPRVAPTPGRRARTP